MQQQEGGIMKRWHARIRYLDAHQVEQVWETDVEAEFVEAARISAERKLHQERQDVAAPMDADVEPVDQTTPAYSSPVTTTPSSALGPTTIWTVPAYDEEDAIAVQSASSCAASR